MEVSGNLAYMGLKMVRGGGNLPSNDLWRQRGIAVGTAVAREARRQRVP